MIITITGKPCSGKGSVGKLFCQKFNFKYLSTGDIFRQIAQQNGINDILQFNKDKRIKKIDKQVDNKTKLIGKQQLNEDILIDSRMAWHFIPNSFKVFLDVGISTAAKRLMAANRTTEQVKTTAQAKRVLLDRWQTENERYLQLYKTNNTNLKNYNLVISTSNKTVEEIVEKIYKSYQTFLKKQK